MNWFPLTTTRFTAPPQRFEVVATRCRTGKAEFFDKSSCPEMIQAVRASGSIPMLSRMVKVNHKNYLDGGVSLPIAYQRAFDLGYEKVVLVLTRHRGYRKKETDSLTQKAYERYFKPLPELRESLRQVPERYNRMQAEIDRLNEEGRVFIIRPEYPVEVSRFEQDVRKLEKLYDEGVRIAEAQMDALKKFLAD